MVGNNLILSGGFWNMLKFGLKIQPILLYLYILSFAIFLWQILHFVLTKQKLRKHNIPSLSIYQLNERLCRFLYIFILLAVSVLCFCMYKITLSIDDIIYVYQSIGESLFAAELIDGIIEYSSFIIAQIFYAILNLCFYCILAIWKRNILHRWYNNSNVE